MNGKFFLVEMVWVGEKGGDSSKFSLSYDASMGLDADIVQRIFRDLNWISLRVAKRNDYK
jgi:hypothetical protein